MSKDRPHSRVAVGAVIIAVLALCSGCWQKIEYTGPSPSANKTQNPPAHAASTSTQAKQTESASPAGPPVAVDTDNRNPTTGPSTTRSTETPIPNTSTKIAPKSDDDRYAVPAKNTDTASASKSAAKDASPSMIEQPQDVTRHTDATPASATVEVAPRAATPNFRHSAWLLGSKLSLAALAHDRGMAADKVPNWFGEAQSAAKSLGTSVTALPDPAKVGDAAPASQQVIDYLVAQGRHIGSDLSQKYGPETAALFEVALKSNILILLYSPDSPATNSISAAISRAAPQGGLPADLWKPLVEMLGKQSSLDDVRAAVRKMHNDVDKYLANAAEQSPR